MKKERIIILLGFIMAIMMDTFFLQLISSFLEILISIGKFTQQNGMALVEVVIGAGMADQLLLQGRI